MNIKERTLHATFESFMVVKLRILIAVDLKLQKFNLVRKPPTLRCGKATAIGVRKDRKLIGFTKNKSWSIYTIFHLVTSTHRTIQVGLRTVHLLVVLQPMGGMIKHS